MLDQRLFDVDRLVESGYDDDIRPTLPLIVRSASGVGARTGLSAAAAAEVRPLSAVGGLAVTIRKTETRNLWSQVVSAPAAMAAGISKVWLDARMYPAVDRSVPQIGAPTAWGLGFTGRNVKVAVLDSGYDRRTRTSPDGSSPPGTSPPTRTSWTLRATEAAGATARQTVIRAYQLR